jgi:hypothetical protein
MKEAANRGGLLPLRKGSTMSAADYVFGAAATFVISCNLYFGPRISGNRIAMQWGLDGKPTWYAPKQIGLWGVVAFMLAARLLIWAASTYDPDQVHGVEIGIIFFSITVAAAHCYILISAAKADRTLSNSK